MNPNLLQISKVKYKKCTKTEKINDQKPSEKIEIP